ncbi:unnamed protein product [Cylindrotheca closterium]|uniref:Hexose transporter 1 n=1 Tax=Cylindrotheca closterium TaxID=2856 RepID=A0AAD2CLK8_9STRA|nr:unnamed protein product [Cylindrotheca closterium]
MQSSHISVQSLWPSWVVVRITAIASLGGVLFGYDSGCISGALPQIQESLALDSGRSELIVSTLYFGAVFGAVVGSSICDLFGRRTTILLTDVVFIIGAVCLFLSTNYADIILGRFIVGIAVAISGIADVSYLHEISPIEIRGAIVSVNEASISLGFLLAYVSGFIYRSAADEEYRMIFGWAGAVAMIQFFGMINLPESPVWLDSQGRKQESQAAQSMISGIPSTATIDPIGQPHIRDSIGSSCDQGRVKNSDGMEYHEANDAFTQPFLNRRQSATQLFKTYRRQMIISLFLSTTQQFCGQASVINYAPYIFALSHNENRSVHLQTLSIGLVKFAVTVIVVLRIEKFGRRALLLGGMFLISIGQFFLALAFSGLDGNSDFSINGVIPHLALPGALLVVCGYSMSFGPLGWLLTSELFPTEFRARALGMSTIVTYLCASMVTNTFLTFLSEIGASATFATYGIFNTLGMVFAFLAIPETDGKRVEQIEVSMQEMWWWKVGDHHSQFENDYRSMSTETPRPEMTR